MRTLIVILGMLTGGGSAFADILVEPSVAESGRIMYARGQPYIKSVGPACELIVGFETPLITRRDRPLLLIGIFNKATEYFNLDQKAIVITDQRGVPIPIVPREVTIRDAEKRVARDRLVTALLFSSGSNRSKTTGSATVTGPSSSYYGTFRSETEDALADAMNSRLDEERAERKRAMRNSALEAAKLRSFTPRTVNPGEMAFTAVPLDTLATGITALRANVACHSQTHTFSFDVTHR